MNFGKLLLALTICCALTGFTTSAAAATPGQFLHSKYPNSVHAEDKGNGVLSVDGQNVTCTSLVLNGATQNGPATELALTPTYSGCTAFGFSGATFATNGCTYRLTQPEGAGDGWGGGFAIKCPEGKKLTIESGALGSNCKVEIGEQTLPSGVSYENDTTNGEIDLAFKLTGIKVSKVADNGLCPLSGTGTVNNGTYTGPFTFEAVSGGNLAVGGFGSGAFLHSNYPNSAHAQNGNSILTVDGQATTCNSEELSGATQNGPEAELVLTPTFKNCTAFGFASATVAANGCTYRLAQPEGAVDKWAGGFAIKCPEGKKLTIESGALGSNCKVEIGEQTLPSGVSYENDTTNGEIDLAFKLTGIKVSKVADNGLCPLSGTGTVNNGTYTGPFTFEAVSGGNLAVG